MKLFSGLVATLVACSATVIGMGEEWQTFVTSQSGTIVPIGIPSYTQGDPIIVGSLPVKVAITPDRTKALVTDAYSNEISVLDLTTSPISTSTVSIPGVISTFGIAVTPNGNKALVACDLGSEVHSVAFLDLTTNPITVDPSSIIVPISGTIAITPDGKHALIGGLNSSAPVLTVLDLTTTPFSVSTNLVIGFFSGGIAITPDGKRALAISSLLSAVTVLDLTTTPISVETSLIPLTLPACVAIAPDGKTAAVTVRANVGNAGGGVSANGGGGVVFFDLTTTPISVIDTPSFAVLSPIGLAITPDQAPTAHFFVKRDEKKVTFNARSSTSPVGSVEKYHWKFGDGHKKTTTSPVVTHKYHSLYHKHSKRPIAATLTVTNTAGTSTRVVFTGQTVSRNGGPSAVCKHPVTMHSRGPDPRTIVKDKSLSLSALLMAAQ